MLAESRLGEVLLLQNRFDEADPLFARSLDMQILLYGAQSRQVADVLDSLASIRRAQGKLKEAESFARRALTANETTVGMDHKDTGYFRISLAVILAKLGKYAEAETLLKRALVTFDKTLPPDHQYVASAEHVLGEVLLDEDKLDEAETTLTAAMNRWNRTPAPAWRAARSESALGETLRRLGKTAEAERHLTESYLVLAGDEHADRDAKLKAQQRITRFYTDRGQREKLKELMLATSGDLKAPAARPN